MATNEQTPNKPLTFENVNIHFFLTHPWVFYFPLFFNMDLWTFKRKHWRINTCMKSCKGLFLSMNPLEHIRRTKQQLCSFYLFVCFVYLFCLRVTVSTTGMTQINSGVCISYSLTVDSQAVVTKGPSLPKLLTHITNTTLTTQWISMKVWLQLCLKNPKLSRPSNPRTQRPGLHHPHLHTFLTHWTACTEGHMQALLHYFSNLRITHFLFFKLRWSTSSGEYISLFNVVN